MHSAHTQERECGTASRIFKCLPLWFAPSISQFPDKVSCSIDLWALMLLRTNELLVTSLLQSVRGFLLPLLHGLDVGGEISRQEQTEETSKDCERAYFQHRLPHGPFAELAGMSICIWQVGK